MCVLSVCCYPCLPPLWLWLHTRATTLSPHQWGGGRSQLLPRFVLGAGSTVQCIYGKYL